MDLERINPRSDGNFDEGAVDQSLAVRRNFQVVGHLFALAPMQRFEIGIDLDLVDAAVVVGSTNILVDGNFVVIAPFGRDLSGQENGHHDDRLFSY